MDAQIEAFLTFLEVEKRASRNTLSAYQSDLKQFTRSVGRQIPPAGGGWEAVTDAMLLTFVEELRGRRYKAATVARKVAAGEIVLRVHGG